MIPASHAWRVANIPAKAPTQKKTANKPRGSTKTNVPAINEPTLTPAETPTIQPQLRWGGETEEMGLESEFIKDGGGGEDPGGFRP